MYFNRYTFLWCALIIFNIKLVFTLQENPSFQVAVVEYQPSFSLSQNTENYLNIINSIPDGVKLVVFPESTLTSGSPVSTSSSTELPDEESDEIICSSTDVKYAYFVRNFSCIAIERNISLVVNLRAREACDKSTSGTVEPCPDSGFYYYNTDVFFNNKGQIGAHYFKRNLFGENGMSTPASHASTFKIEDYEFGMFTCFDLLFYTPTLTLTRKLNISNIIFPTMWFSELPFLTALQAQQMWAYENDVTFMSSGASNPLLGSGGTGIFLGKEGPLNYTFSPKGGVTIIIEDIGLISSPSNPPDTNEIDEIAKDMDNVVFKKENLEDYHSELLNLNPSSNIEQVVCHETFCCYFNIELNYDNTTADGNSYVYHLISFSGTRIHGGFINTGTEVCSVVACLDESISSCGSRFSNYSNVVWPVTFNAISVEAFFDNAEETIQFPNSLLSSIRPISPSYTAFEKEEVNTTHVKRTFKLIESQSRLMAFGIYGRDFRLDSLVSGYSKVSINIIMIACMVISVRLFNVIY